MKIALLIISLGTLIVVEYVCCVAAKKADEQAEELYRRYMEYKEHERSTGTDDIR